MTHRERQGLPTTTVDGAIETIRSGLANGVPVRCRLPEKGVLVIDRPLPFLVVHRVPPANDDRGTDRLIRSEASYLVAPGDRSHHRWVSRLVREVVRELASQFDGCLLVELWSDPTGDASSNASKDLPLEFQIKVASSLARNRETWSVLEQAFGKIRVLQRRAIVTTSATARITSGKCAPLLTARQAADLSCTVAGVVVPPVYRAPGTDEVYPLVLRTLRRQLSRALKRGFHQFCHESTRTAPASFLALGRRGFLRAVVDVDEQVAKVSDSFDFLLSVTPVDVNAVWRKFDREHFEVEPKFTYRPLSQDPVRLKRKLFEIPTERIEDPVLEGIYREKQLELDRKLTMLLERSTSKFLYSSIQLFEAPSPELVLLAQEILRSIPPKSRDENKRESLEAEPFAAAARKEIDQYRSRVPEMSSKVEVRPDLASTIMVSKGNLLIGGSARVPVSRVAALLQHEVGTHVVTYINGKAQPLRMFYGGFVGYDELQEGLAVLAEYLVGGMSRPRLRTLAARVVAGHYLVDGASFVEAFRALNHEHRIPQRQSFDIAVRMYRGGGFLKDIVYLRGFQSVLEYITSGGDLEPLFVGKIALRHLPVVRELQLRGVLRETPLRPSFLDLPQADKRLGRLRSSGSVLDLIQTI